MKKKNNNISSDIADLKPGMIFKKTDCIYDKQMIISEKRIQLSDGIYRECVAWNNEQCKRFDTTENELLKSEYIESMDVDSLNKYVIKNSKNVWSECNAPNLNNKKE